MKGIFAAGIAALMLASVPSQQAGAQVGAPAAQAFIIEAARGGLAEVELGRLASQRASSDAVRQFGQRMAVDHGAALQELALLAQRKGVILPQALDANHRAMLDRLAATSGPQFDQTYMAEMVRDHGQDALAFEREARQGLDPDVRAWAGKMLATIREHQRIASDLHARIARAPVGVVPAPPPVVSAPPVVPAPAPVTVLPAPSASPPTTATTTTTVTTTVVPVRPFCGGAYRQDAGTNFGTCY